MLKNKIVLILACLLLANSVISQTKQIRFKRLDINDGLSLSSVYCIFQDSKGFMWFGTEDGLNRFDGKTFKIFRNIPDNLNSISYKWIDQIFEDKNGMLWFGSRGGITSYNPRYETFTQYRNDRANLMSLVSDTVTVLFEDKIGKLWVGTISGLNTINLNTNEISRVSNNKGSLQGLNSRINAISADENGDLWIATNHGLYFHHIKNGDFEKINFKINYIDDSRCKSIIVHEDFIWVGSEIGLIKYDRKLKSSRVFIITQTPENPFPYPEIEKLFEDKQNRLWIGSIQGLYLFDEDKESIVQFIHSPNESNSQAINPLKPIYEDQLANIWYGTFGDGLYKIEPSGIIRNYKNNPSDLSSLSYNSIHSIYGDGAGNLWFGTFGAGICIYAPQSQKFELITSDPADENSLSTNFVWAILEAADGSVWLGTNSRGISRYFPKTGKFIHYDYEPLNSTGISNAKIRKIFQDRSGTIWISTDGGGLDRFIPETNSFKHYKNIPADSTSLSDNAVRGIYEDSKGLLWIGTRNGLNCLDPKTEKFTRFFNSPDNPKSISHNYVYSGIFQDNKGSLWIGTMGGGLNKMDLKTKTFTSYQNNPNDPESISDNSVFWIYQEKDDILWIATNSRLNRFDLKTQKYKRFGIKEGLPNEVIYGILPDKNNHIWLSTNYGICRFNLDTYHTKNFDVSDGLQSNEFNGGAFHLGKSGLMYFAGVYGLNIVDPSKIQHYSNELKTVLTRFELHGIEVKVASEEDDVTDNKVVEVGSDYLMNENISYAKRIELAYHLNVLTFEFSALNAAIPEKVQYAYMMENLDNDWNYSGSRNFVSYARLKPGHYIFKVRSQNGDGRWNNNIAKLEIIIKPPLWKTWWFMLFELNVFFAIVFFVYRYLLNKRTNRILQQQNEQIRQANFKLSESEQNLKNLNATKDKFFSIISHDLKNPFTSLISISESMSEGFDSFNDEDKRTVFQKIHVSLKHINTLLNNLLTWANAQSGKIDFNPLNFNISKIIEVNVNLYRLAAEKKGIEIESDINDEIMVYADRGMIDTVIRNLLNNAIKFSDNGDIISITINYLDSMIEVQVKDQGKGIDKQDIEKLFRIDMKFKSKGTSGESGTGLGLILCKEFVEKNNGKIKVQSSPGVGSTFSFTIPLSFSGFSKQ